MNDIARVHQPEPDPPRNRRSDMAINQLKLGVVDRALVALDRSGILPDQRFLIVQVLPRDHFLRVKFLVARIQNFVVLERRQILGERAFGLRQLHLVRTRIDLSQQIAGFYDLPLGKIYLHELSVDPALDGDRVVGASPFRSRKCTGSNRRAWPAPPRPERLGCAIAGGVAESVLLRPLK